jgi:hypothetical protein
MFKGKVLLFSLLLVFATSLHAGDVDGVKSEAGTTCTLRVAICPAGDFQEIRTGCGGVADYIWVEVKDAGGFGIEGIPWTDYWISACVPDPTYGDLCFCVAPMIADSLTNSAGRTTFSGTIAAGGCILTGGFTISCQGKVFLQEGVPGEPPICLDLIIVGPDLQHDCVVNVSDLSIFGDHYNTFITDLDYNDCCDWTDDDWVDISDFSFLGEHYEHTCF